jgi:uncharacterized protein (TIGR02594 family)
MQPLPAQWQWIQDSLNANNGSPHMITEALKEFGVHEGLGELNNQEILAWAKEVGGNVADVYKNDAIPWCGLFMAVIAKRAGKQLPKDPLWALNWGTFGVHVDQPMFGDVCTFVRHTPDGKTAGHVALYLAQNTENYFIIGGNQHDEVCIMGIAKTRLYTARRPIYQIGLPANVKTIILDDATSVPLSTNEQ